MNITKAWIVAQIIRQIRASNAYLGPVRDTRWRAMTDARAWCQTWDDTLAPQDSGW